MPRGGQLLEGGVERRGDLAPGRRGGLRLRVLELLPEHRDVRVVGEGRIVPRRPARPAGRSPRCTSSPGSPGRTGTGRTPRRRPCSCCSCRRRGCCRRRTTWRLTFFGIGAIAHLPSISAPPASLMRPRCHGPEKNIGWVPATNAGVMSKPSGTDFGRELVLEERLVVGQGLDGLRAVELVCARVVGDVTARGPQEREVLLPVLGAQRDAPLGAALVLHRLGHRRELVPRRGRSGDAGLLGDVGAVVEEPGLDVPRHAVHRSVDHVRVPGALEVRGSDRSSPARAPRRRSPRTGPSCQCPSGSRRASGRPRSRSGAWPRPASRPGSR